MNTILMLGIFAAVFTIIYQDKYDRLQVVFVGACTMLIIGMLLGNYTPLMALESIYFETLALIFGMSLISAILSRSGAFAYIAERTISYSAGSGWLVVILLTLLTYAFSLVANNLATMVVILPLSLTLCLRMGIQPIPLLIAEIIASNLGGASTMIGDFPNMIISTAASLSFLDFIGGMMVATLVLLAALLLFLQSRRAEFKPSGSLIKILDTDEKDNSVELDHFLLKLGVYSLIIVLVLFIFADSLGITPAYVAIITGIILIELGAFKRHELINVSGARDIMFFACLFIMVGALKATGTLDLIASLIENMGANNKTFSILLLMWIAAIVTLFLNAGPSTAFFIPVAMSIYTNYQDVTVWWALSLGVLAGSSAALTGATAGSLATTHLADFNKHHPELKAIMGEDSSLSFKRYLRWGIPVMFIFLGISTLYILLLLQ